MINKLSFIKKLPSGKWRVLSHKGKNLGTYDTKEDAVTRLRQVEYFKDNNHLEDDKIIDLMDIDDFSFSAIMRKLRKKTNPITVKEFLIIFKNQFDRAIFQELHNPEKVALQNALLQFNKIYKVKLDPEMVKNAAISELGNAAEVGQYLANIIRFILNRLPSDKLNSAIEKLKNKFYYMNSNELSNKDAPPSAAIGQSITFVKHVLFNQDPTYIREVLSNISKSL